MKFTVIIPAYNAEKTIENTLDSLVNQSYADFQAIVVDDGSCDKTLEIITKYASKDSRFEVFHKENGGIASAYQMAFEHIKGSYVTFVDSDDALAPEMFETVESAIHRTNCDIIQFGMRYCDPSGKVIRRRIFTEKEIQGKNNILLDYFSGLDTGANSPSLGIRAFKRELLEGVDFWKGSLGIDEMLTPFALSKANCIHFIPEMLYYCCVTANSVSRCPVSPEKVKSILYSMDKLSDIVQTDDERILFWLSVKKLRYYATCFNTMHQLFTKKEIHEYIKKEYVVYKKHKKNVNRKTRMKLWIMYYLPFIYGLLCKM